MAMKKQRRKADGREALSVARLARSSSKASSVRHQGPADNGTLPVNTGGLKLPQELTEEEESKDSLFQRVDPAVAVILCCSLIFIVVIAFVIWNGWEPPR